MSIVAVFRPQHAQYVKRTNDVKCTNQATVHDSNNEN